MMSSLEKAHCEGFEGLNALSALPFAILVVNRKTRICFLNDAVEQLFEQGAHHLLGKYLTDLFEKNSPICSLVLQAYQNQVSVVEYDVTLGLTGNRNRNVSITAAPVMEEPEFMVLSVHEESNARRIHNHNSQRNAARSVTGLAALLAHEVKNPLSGIRGAAQLLEAAVTEDDRNLTRLICEETDRICSLVDSMEVFSHLEIKRKAVNIHRVLERVKNIAEAGFGKNVSFMEEYDPSLPPVWGNEDQLIQVFLNIVKNACEAVPKGNGKIVIRTGYRHGIRLSVPGAAPSIPIPLTVTVSDNGLGIGDDVASNLFDPFVTSKLDGTGLGLALVAKTISDHGGLIDFNSSSGGTEFNICLPAFIESLEASQDTLGQ